MGGGASRVTGEKINAMPVLPIFFSLLDFCTPARSSFHAGTDLFIFFATEMQGTGSVGIPACRGCGAMEIED